MDIGRGSVPLIMLYVQHEPPNQTNPATLPLCYFALLIKNSHILRDEHCDYDDDVKHPFIILNYDMWVQIWWPAMHCTGLRNPGLCKFESNHHRKGLSLSLVLLFPRNTRRKSQRPTNNHQKYQSLALNNKIWILLLLLLFHAQHCNQ